MDEKILKILEEIRDNQKIALKRQEETTQLYKSEKGKRLILLVIALILIVISISLNLFR